MRTLITLFNQTVLWQALREIVPYLQGPTLIYHDGSGDADTVVRSLSDSRPIVTAVLPERPYEENFHTVKSTILITESIEPMIERLRGWLAWQARSRVVLIMNNATDVRRWIEQLWKKTRAADILAIVLSEQPEYYTWFPYQPVECTDVSTIVRLNSSNLFPVKFKSLNNCPLIGVTTVMLPFVANETHGLETRIFLEIAKKLEMTPRYTHVPPGTTVWPVLDAYLRPQGSLKFLEESQADVLFSLMAMSFHTFPYADFLTSLMTDEYYFFAPGPLEAPRATAIYRAFAPQAWLLVVIASIIIYLSVALIPFLETGKLGPSLIHTIAIILNVSSNLPPSRKLLLFAVAAYMYSMHITTAYTTSFIVFLSNAPREKPMKTLEDLVDSGLKVQLPAALRLTVAAVAEGSKMESLVEPGRSLQVGYLNLTSVATGESALLGPGISFQAMLRQDIFYDEYDFPCVLIIKPAIFYAFLTFYISKGHPLYNLINKYYIRLFEGGIHEFYKDEVTKPARPSLRNLKPFGINNVEGPFMVLTTCLILCFFAWIGEWAYYWLQKLKRKKPNNSLLPLRNNLRFSIPRSVKVK